MVDRGNFTNMRADLSFVDERVRSQAPIDRMTPLPEDWTPNSWSVICGRGKECYEHVGNRRFRVLVELNLEKYSVAKTKMEKSVIVMGILDTVRDSGGDFVRFNPKTKRWFICKDVIAREKTGQQFRAAILAKESGAEAPQSRSSICNVSKRMSKLKATAKRSSIKKLAPKRVSVQAREEVLSSSIDTKAAASLKVPQEYLELEPLPLRGSNSVNRRRVSSLAVQQPPIFLHDLPAVAEEQPCRMFDAYQQPNTAVSQQKLDVEVDGPDDDDMLRILDAAIRWTKRPAPVPLPSRRVSYEMVAL